MSLAIQEDFGATVAFELHRDVSLAPEPTGVAPDSGTRPGRLLLYLAPKMQCMLCWQLTVSDGRFLARV